jgi:hypothetical protein
VRWNLVNDLFGAFIIDVHDRLVAQALLHAPVTTVPVTETEAINLSQGGAWGEDTAARSTYLHRWSAAARSEFAMQPQSFSTRYRWVPSALFLVLLVFLFLRRLARAL